MHLEAEIGIVLSTPTWGNYTITTGGRLRYVEPFTIRSPLRGIVRLRCRGDSVPERSSECTRAVRTLLQYYWLATAVLPVSICAAVGIRCQNGPMNAFQENHTCPCVAGLYAKSRRWAEGKGTALRHQTYDGMRLRTQIDIVQLSCSAASSTHAVRKSLCAFLYSFPITCSDRILLSCCNCAAVAGT